MPRTAPRSLYRVPPAAPPSRALAVVGHVPLDGSPALQGAAVVRESLPSHDPRAAESEGRLPACALGRRERALLHADFLRARSGCPRSFRRIADRMAPRLERHVKRLLRSDPAARSDVVQEALLSAWQHLGQLRSGDHLVRWLHVVSRNQAISLLRSTRARLRREGRLEAGSVRFEAPARYRDGSRAAELSCLHGATPPLGAAAGSVPTDDVLVALTRTIDRLPEGYRAVVRLHHLEGLETNAVAEALGLSRSNVKMRLWRARRLLARWLPAEAHRMGPAASRDLQAFLEGFAASTALDDASRDEANPSCGGASDAPRPT